MREDTRQLLYTGRPKNNASATWRTIVFSVLVSVQLFAAKNVLSAAGDSITNTATVNFFYQGLPLVQESSPTGNTQVGIGNGTPTSFIEDRLINFSVVANDGSAVAVASGQVDAYQTYTISNNGNAPQDFLLTALNTSPNPFGAPIDNFDPVSLSVFVEDGTTAGYQVAEDTAIFVDELAAGASAVVYLVADIPVTAIGDAAAVALIVQAADGNSVGEGAAINRDDNGNTSPAGTYSNGSTSVSAGVPVSSVDTAGVDTVFNDPAGLSAEDIDSTGLSQDVIQNAQHSDAGAFEVQSAGIPGVSLNKTVTVIDPLGSSDPQTGATLRYRIDVVISGGASIDNLVVTDPVPANTSYTPSSIFVNGVQQTDANDAPTDFSEFNGSDVVVDLSEGGTVSIPPGTPNVIIFEVTID